jgi:hypothetical protein
VIVSVTPLLLSNEHILRIEICHQKDAIVFSIKMKVDGDQDRCVSASVNTRIDVY